MHPMTNQQVAVIADLTNGQLIDQQHPPFSKSSSNMDQQQASRSLALAVDFFTAHPVC